MSVNVQLKDKLKRISGESITSAKILSALGYTPASDTDLSSHKNDSTIHITDSERSTWNNKVDSVYVQNAITNKANKDELFSGDYNDLTNKPIENTDDGTLQIVDEDGNAIMKVNSEGITTHDVKINLGENIVSVKELIDESIEGVRPVAGDHIAIGTDKSINVITESIDVNDTSHPASKNYVDKKVADLVNGAPEALDTLKELGDALGAHEDAYDALLETVGKKADRTELPTINAGNNINVNNTGRDYTVSLEDSIQVTDINTETLTAGTANVTKLQVHESITAPQFIQNGDSFVIADESGNKTLEVDKEGRTTIADLHVKIGEEIKHISDVVVAHVHPYTPSGVINEEVVEDITSTSKPIDDMVVLPAMTMTHSSTNSTLVFSWNAGSVSQDNILTSVGAINVTPTFTGTPSTTDVPTGTDASSIIEPYVVRKLDESY